MLVSYDDVYLFWQFTVTTITLDTQEAVIKLKAVGVSQEHADAFCACYCRISK